MSSTPLISATAAGETSLSALSRWDNEGGAGPGRMPAIDALHARTKPLPEHAAGWLLQPVDRAGRFSEALQ